MGPRRFLLLGALLALLNLVYAATDLDSLPAPLSIDPAQDWEGIDGSWNTFPLRIGTPEQNTRGFISTTSQQTWAVYFNACAIGELHPDGSTTRALNRTCFDDRGRTFDFDLSESWNRIGYYQLWLERELGLVGNGLYGYETVGLGYQAADGPTLENMTVGTLQTPNFWLGHFGLHPKSTNFSHFRDPSPSFMSQLYETKQIPSVAWAYTAGAQYRNGITLASLTLGGYDESRFIPNNLTFGFAPDNERDITVGIVGIEANSATKHAVDLLGDRQPFSMHFDSTVAELYLPLEVCEAFEKAFGLVFDNETNLYLVDDLLHEKLMVDDPSITFRLGQKFATNYTVDITLPYEAFDLTARMPYQNLTRPHRYFPIRRSVKESNFILGRTFLQEAYLVVDWERQNFTVSAVDWTYGKTKNIVPIISPKYTGELDQSAGLSSGMIAGVAIGAGAVLLLLVVGIWWVWRRRAQRKQKEEEAAYAKHAADGQLADSVKLEEPTSPTTEAGGTTVFPKAELPTEFYGDVKVEDASGQSHEVDNTEHQIFEMPGDMPVPQEAGGRQLSEKESMIVRERIYNGVDPNGPPSVSPTATEPPRRLLPISAEEVMMVRGQPPNISPITPRTPQDGSSLGANDTFFQAPTRSARRLDAEDMLSPISPLEEVPRRRFSYES